MSNRITVEFQLENATGTGIADCEFTSVSGISREGAFPCFWIRGANPTVIVRANILKKILIEREKAAPDMPILELGAPGKNWEALSPILESIKSSMLPAMGLTEVTNAMRVAWIWDDETDGKK